MRVLSAASECAPFFKRGGLGEAVAGLAKALTLQGIEVTVVMPAYREVLSAWPGSRTLWRFTVAGMAVRVLELASAHHGIWLVDIAPYFDREGDAYDCSQGMAWPDDARRFSAFSEAVALLAGGALDYESPACLRSITPCIREIFRSLPFMTLGCPWCGGRLISWSFMGDCHSSKPASCLLTS